MKKHQELYESPLYAWQELSGCPQWRFQTDRPEIKAKLIRREGFEYRDYGFNCNLWIFLKDYEHPRNALRALERISGGKAEFDPEKGIYFASYA